MAFFERTYRRRLEADVVRWQADGIITPAIGDAIRGTLPPLGGGINIPAIIAIVGGLLIAAAFLAFVASNWTEMPRVLRFAMLLTGIGVAHGAGAVFVRHGRAILADLSVSVGTIIFGAAIALVGQMYHLGDDFAAGMLLWAAGALAAAALTGSRGALAVALAAGALWSGSRAAEGAVPHVPFALFWLVSAGLVLTWNSRVAAHLAAIAGLVWWVMGAVMPSFINTTGLTVADGAALMLGAGLLMGNSRPRLQSFGVTLSTYGAFALAMMAAVAVLSFGELHLTTAAPPAWAAGCGLAGLILAAAAALPAATASHRAGSIFCAVAIAFSLVVAHGWAQPAAVLGGGWPQLGDEPWLVYALELVAMLCLVVSGMLDEVRPRMVAGWLGLAGVIASVTWAVKGSLLRRSVFLAIAGAAAMTIATLLGRWLPGENPGENRS
jgi:uncharacterized membrane protein